jgi:hypothetical protein
MAIVGGSQMDRRLKMKQAIETALETYSERTTGIRRDHIVAKVPGTVQDLLNRIDDDLEEVSGKLVTLGFDAEAKKMAGIIATLKEATMITPVKRTKSCWLWHDHSAWIHIATVATEVKDQHYNVCDKYTMIMMRECVRCGVRQLSETTLYDPAKAR